MSPTPSQIIADNLARIRERLSAAALRSGRAEDAVRMISVTKYVDADLARAVVEAGCRELGESRPQELWAKAEALSNAGICWHLVGHLQRNKVRRTLPLVGLFHSCDSLRLLAELDREAGRQAIVCQVLLEVNISGDEAKHGIAPADLQAVLEGVGEATNVRVRGLMTMAAREGGEQRARENFAALRQLRDSLRAACPENATLDELSMGMSGDFEAAVEEGATMVRIGSKIFAGLI